MSKDRQSFCGILVAIDDVFVVTVALLWLYCIVYSMPHICQIDKNLNDCEKFLNLNDFFRMSLSDADLESIRELFLNFDSNSDGTISNRELQHFINSIQGKPDE